MILGQKYIDKQKEEMACDLKLSGDTFIRMMSSLENVIFRGCKMVPPGIFDKYDENKSGIIKDLDKLKSQLKIQIKVFLASYDDMVQKNNGKYPFPLNFSEEKVKKLIESFKIMAINYQTGDEIYCQAIESIFKGDYDKVYHLLPNKNKHLGMDPKKQIEYFTPVNGKVYDTTEKAIKEFREKGSINHVVDIAEDKINSLINIDPIIEVYRLFKLLISFPSGENASSLYQKILEFYDFHSKQANEYSFPKKFETKNFLAFLDSNMKNNKNTSAFYYYSALINNILNYKYDIVNKMLNQ